MRWYLPALLLAGCGLAGADQAGPETEGRSVPAAEATRVEVVTLQPSPARIALHLPGEVEGFRDAQLAAANGGQVEAVRVREGERVRRGQALMRIDAELYAAQVAQAEAQHEQAAAALERVRQLGDLASESQLLDASTGEKVTAAALRQARARLSRALVTAPFDGVIATVAVEEGEFAPPGSPVARLVQLDPVMVSLSVSDRDVISLEPGTPVTVTAAARAGSFPGTIARISQAADLRTRAFTVDVEVPNPDGLLLPGMIARVAVERELASDVLLIPQDWLVTRRDARGVFLEEEGHASWRPVTLGDIVHDDVIVTSGLSAGARVVITGHRELMDGDPLLVAREGTCCAAGRPVFGE